MSNVNLPELRESLKKIRSVHLSIGSYDTLRSKLAVLLVQAGLKSAFLQLMKGNLNGFKGIGLKFLNSGLPPPYYYGSPKVPGWFLTEYNRVSQIERRRTKCMWFYADDGTYPKIMSSLNGELDDGYILDYPDCCVKWYERMESKEIEILHHYVMDRYELKTRKAVIDALEHSEARSFSHMFVQMHTSENLEKTVSKFPFVFHIACPTCLKGSNESASLNVKYEQLALSLERTFHNEIIEASLEYITKVKESRSVYMKEFYESKRRFPFLGRLENVVQAE